MPKLYYQKSKGIDVSGSEMFFVSKEQKELFSILHLDDMTYTAKSTVSGVFFMVHRTSYSASIGRQ